MSSTLSGSEAAAQEAEKRQSADAGHFRYAGDEIPCRIITG